MTVERAAEILSTAKKGVAFTGAGASADSGIPTFRGVGALWSEDTQIMVACLKELGFVVNAGDPRRRVAACPGAPACAGIWAVGFTFARRPMKAFARRR